MPRKRNPNTKRTSNNRLKECRCCGKKLTRAIVYLHERKHGIRQALISNTANAIRHLPLSTHQRRARSSSESSLQSFRTVSDLNDEDLARDMADLAVPDEFPWLRIPQPRTNGNQQCTNPPSVPATAESGGGDGYEPDWEMADERGGEANDEESEEDDDEVKQSGSDDGREYDEENDDGDMVSDDTSFQSWTDEEDYEDDYDIPQEDEEKPWWDRDPMLGVFWELEMARIRSRATVDMESSEGTALKAYKFFLETDLGANAYLKLRHTFKGLEIPSLKKLRRHMHNLSGIEPVFYDCCCNSCMCFVGPHADKNTCDYCHQPRFLPSGKSANQFQYIPIIPQFRALYAGKESSKLMRHRHRFQNRNRNRADHPIEDVYDSHLYRTLQDSYITVNGRQLPRKYFADPRDVFLTSLTDGFQLFKRRNHTAWPMIFLNNNLAPELRYRLSNLICCGLIPGPRKPKDHDSFTYVLIEELNQAALGVSTYDAAEDELFALRIFAALNCADMPAAASAHTGGKHPGAKVPCHFCPIEGIRIQDSSNLSFYLPLVRPAHYPPLQYTIDTLPLRTHAKYMRQARKVDRAQTVTRQQELAKRYGINGTPIMSKAPGVLLPFSSPADFMHLIENTCSNYVALICGEFKGLDAGREAYILEPAIWKQIGAITVKATETIPSAFGSRIPDVSKERTYFTCEAYLVWCTLYAPILLRHRFALPKYYTHWQRLVSIIQRCLKFKTTKTERDQLRMDIKKWYCEYERFFYQRLPHRLVACVLTVHMWLHLVDIMEQSGPLWAYWCWAMERFCGRLTRVINSRKHPYASLNRRIHEIQTLHAIRAMYNLEEDLPPYTAMYNDSSLPSYHNSDLYPDITLRHPRRILSFDEHNLQDLKNRIIVYLRTQYDISTQQAKSVLPTSITQFGKLDIREGDTIYSSVGYGKRQENQRDASFMQYELLVDQFAHQRNAQPVYAPRTFFGQLERAFVCELRPSRALGTHKVTPLILLDVHCCNAKADRFGIYEYSSFRSREIVDGTSVRALVGRIEDRGKWAFVRRPENFEHASYNVID